MHGYLRSSWKGILKLAALGAWTPDKELCIKVTRVYTPLVSVDTIQSPINCNDPLGDPGRSVWKLVLLQYD